jgi:PhzF family phenazine biosynthesis protein
VLRRFSQVDVFSPISYQGNPVAVVFDCDGLGTEQMRAFARWSNLSESTFVLAPTDTSADYRVRIFTPTGELPFAGHPTLGTCHAWLATASQSPQRESIVQECGAGLVRVRRTDDGLAFAAPKLIRSGPVDEATIDAVAAELDINRSKIVDAAWADNGPGWVAMLLESADAVLRVRPKAVHRDIGVIGPYSSGSPEAYEVRAFFEKDGSTTEDPVTGSLNAAVAQWLLGSGRAVAPYVARQGTVLSRTGRVHISRDVGGTIWVGGATVTCISGTVEL